MKIHITLVGGQPAPVYNGIIATQPDKVVFVYSDNSIRTVEMVRSVISLPVDDIPPLHPTDPDKILECANLLADKYKNDYVTLNISSGLKSWSHLFGRVFDGRPNASVVYMDQNNVLWNYSDNTHKDGFEFDMFTLFKLYGHPLEDNYRRLDDYTSEDENVLDVIEEARYEFPDVFTPLMAFIEDPRQSRKIKRPEGSIMQFPSNVDWKRPKNDKDSGVVNICLCNKNGRGRNYELISPHAVDMAFNSGWMEYKVARFLSDWDKAKGVYLNCRFKFRNGRDRNEVDVIVDAGSKILFVECKTQIIHTVDIDKFNSVIKTYGGNGSKGLFVTYENMDDDARNKCREYGIIPFSLMDFQNGYNGGRFKKMGPADMLYYILDSELMNINV